MIQKERLIFGWRSSATRLKRRRGSSWYLKEASYDSLRRRHETTQLLGQHKHPFPFDPATTLVPGQPALAALSSMACPAGPFLLHGHSSIIRTQQSQTSYAFITNLTSYINYVLIPYILHRYRRLFTRLESRNASEPHLSMPRPG